MKTLIFLDRSGRVSARSSEIAVDSPESGWMSPDSRGLFKNLNVGCILSVENLLSFPWHGANCSGVVRRRTAGVKLQGEYVRSLVISEDPFAKGKPFQNYSPRDSVSVEKVILFNLQN